jgi:hypothetical protein
MQWKLAHNVGTENHSNYNTREQILNCQDQIGFDGIYQSLYQNQDILKGKSGILFVMGNYMGKDNTFDLPHVPKLERYCDMSQVMELCVKYNFKVGWHTWSHPDLTQLTDEEVIKEITPPFQMDYFAYPYGIYDNRIIQLVKQAGYKEAYSVTQGSTNPNEPDYKFKIYRDYIR